MPRLPQHVACTVLTVGRSAGESRDADTRENCRRAGLVTRARRGRAPATSPRLRSVSRYIPLSACASSSFSDVPDLSFVAPHSSYFDFVRAGVLLRRDRAPHASGVATSHDARRVQASTRDPGRSDAVRSPRCAGIGVSRVRHCAAVEADSVSSGARAPLLKMAAMLDARDAPRRPRVD